MLKKENRIRHDKEFDRIFKTGQSFYGRILGIKAVNNETDLVRVGIIISTKISKKAVERNKLRRQIRSIIKLELDKIKTGHDLVVITLPAILKEDYQTIEHEIKIGLSKLHLYNK